MSPKGCKAAPAIALSCRNLGAACGRFATQGRPREGAHPGRPAPAGLRRCSSRAGPTTPAARARSPVQRGRSPHRAHAPTHDQVSGQQFVCNRLYLFDTRFTPHRLRILRRRFVGEHPTRASPSTDAIRAKIASARTPSSSTFISSRSAAADRSVDAITGSTSSGPIPDAGE